MKVNVILAVLLCTVMTQAALVPHYVAQEHKDFEAHQVDSATLERRMSGVTSMKIVAAVAAGLSWPFYLIGGSMNAEALNQVSKTQNQQLLDMQMQQYESSRAAALRAHQRAPLRPKSLIRRGIPISTLTEVADVTKEITKEATKEVNGKYSGMDTGLTVALLTAGLGNLAVSMQSMWNGYHNKMNAKAGLETARLQHARYAQYAPPARASF